MGERMPSVERGDGDVLVEVVDRLEKKGSRCKRGTTSAVNFRDGPGELSSWKYESDSEENDRA